MLETWLNLTEWKQSEWSDTESGFVPGFQQEVEQTANECLEPSSSSLISLEYY